jgi:hypothetical protein
MNITKFVSTNIYLIMTLFICTISYIYVVNGLKCHIVLGVCSIGIEGIVSYSVYVVLLSVCKEEMTRQKLSKRKPIVSEDTGKNSMPIITEKHDILPVQEINTKETDRQMTVTQCKEYIEKVVAQYFPEELTPQLLHLVEEYASGIIRCTPIKIGINDTKGLRPIDFYHLIWNLWTRLDALDRRASCRFIKNAFPMILENTNEETIYRKMNDTYVRCTIENIPKDEPLVP